MLSKFFNNFTYVSSSNKKNRKLFRKMDKHLNRALLYLIPETKFFEDSYIKRYMEIASGNARFNLFYDKDKTNRKNFKASMHKGFSKEDALFLLKNISLIRVGLNSSNFNMFNRRVKVEILEEFLNNASDYISACNDLDSLRRDYIERCLGVSSNSFYGSLKVAKYHYDKFIKFRDEIARRYYRYVISLSKNDVSTTQTEENFQMGVQGLLKAILLYNYKKKEGYTFATYASGWINQAILSGVHKSSLIEVPQDTWQDFRDIERHRESSNSIEDLSKRSGFNQKKIEEVYDRILTSQVTSLDVILDSGDSSLDTIVPEEYNTPEVDDEVFLQLTPEERRVACVMFGNYNLLDNSKELNENCKINNDSVLIDEGTNPSEN